MERKKLILFAVVGWFVFVTTVSGEPTFRKPVRKEVLNGPHVRGSSYTVPKDFVDGQWEGIIAAGDGNTYFSVSSHSPHHNAQFYRYNAGEQTVEHLINVAKWTGQEEYIGKHNVQGKIHSQIFEVDGKLYCTSTAAHRTPPDLDGLESGGRFLSYDLETGEFKNLGRYPDPKSGLHTAYYEPVKNRLYAISQTNRMLVYYDLETGTIHEIGSVKFEDSRMTRQLLSDKHGNIYGGTGPGLIWRYRPATDSIHTLLTRIPDDPEAPRPEPDSFHSRWRHWHPIEKDPETGWWYGVRTNDEYLFRIRPSRKPETGRAEVEGLVPFGYRPSEEQPRFASLALVKKGERLFYCSYAWNREPAHLMSYHLPSGRVTDHGPIVTEGRRAVTEIHSMVLGNDGNLHAVAMVWSLKGEDPANGWATRSKRYFHARFLIIDPAAHLKNQGNTRTWK